jgi:hypothetical protein
VIELGNDGYLPQFFIERGIPVLGIVLTAERIFAAHGMRISDVEELARREREAGLRRLETYSDSANRFWTAKRKLLRFLVPGRYLPL